MNPDWRSRYEAAIEFADQAGRLALGYFDRPLVVERKSDASPVTVADRTAEEFLRGRIDELFPTDSILGEEFPEKHGTSGYRWILDPIDGTKSFIRAVPLWGTLVGIEYEGEAIIGAAAAPPLGQIYHAARGNGAYRDGVRIRVTDVESLSECNFTYSSASYFVKAGKEDAFLKLVRSTDRQRGYGDFYAFALVAQGSFDVAVDCGCNAWDLAAMKPIVEEAGGRFTDWDGTPTIHRPDVVASNGKLHEKVMEILNG